MCVRAWNSGEKDTLNCVLSKYTLLWEKEKHTLHFKMSNSFKWFDLGFTQVKLVGFTDSVVIKPKKT